MADPRCRQVFALLSEYLDGELKIKDCRGLEAHLRGCQPCLRYLRTLKLTKDACRQYGKVEPLVLSTDPCSTILARLIKGIRQQGASQDGLTRKSHRKRAR